MKMRAKQWQGLCPRPAQAVWLLLPALFVLGFWLGLMLAPAPLLLHLAALPALDEQQARAARAQDLLQEGQPLVLEAGLDEIGQTVDADAQTDGGEAILLLTPAQAGLTSPAATDETQADTQDATADADTPRAVIYCTHTAEEYAGQTRQKGQAGGVLAVAQSLAQALEQRGVAVILDESIHDSDYNSSYAHSLQAMQAIAAQYPQIELYIDVHRDSAIEGISTTLRAGDVDYARLLLIVGSDQQLQHPQWQSNLSFARQLCAQTESLLPGLTRGEPRVYSGRYNQHLGKQAILVEFGSTENTQEQAQRSAQVLAQAIVDCWQQEQ